MSAKPGFAWRIRARACRRDIADEPVARIATLARISCDFYFCMVWITDDGRLERNGRSDASPNGQDIGLRSRGLMHPEHALSLAELFPDVKWLVDGV